MAQLSDDDVRHIAKLARLRLSDAEVKKFSKELTSILEYIDVLNELDTEGACAEPGRSACAERSRSVEPTAQVTGLSNVLREDEAQPSEAAKDDLLGCSPLPIVNDQIETLSAHGN